MESCLVLTKMKSQCSQGYLCVRLLWEEKLDAISFGLSTVLEPSKLKSIWRLIEVKT